MISILRIAVAIAASGLLGIAAQAQDAGADYQARLEAGREAAYRRYLLQPEHAPANNANAAYTGGSASTGSTGATFRASGGLATPALRVSVGGSNMGSPSFSLRSQLYAPTTGPTRYNYNFNYRYRPSELNQAALIYHPNYDPRNRRSWPRPVQTRTWVPTHWTWDGSRYHYVRGHTVYETKWVTVGRERWHFNGSHYSVVKSFR